MAGEWLAYGELGLAVIGFAPFALHRWSCNKWANNKLLCPQSSSKLPITILLPVWNESLIIEKKLSNIANQNFDVDLFVIDSASTDDTVEKINSWLNDFPDAFNDYQIVRMEERLGKTKAVMHAMDMLENFSGIIVMTDADSMMEPDSLNRINRWFSNPQIGAVGGTPNRIGNLKTEDNYRDIYAKLRVGESYHDSTPFLEGSLLAWRSSSVSSQDLYSKSNADDAQIATAVRLNGLRSIQDPDLIFKDYMPLTNKDQRRQKVRRAQGLVRLLVRKRRHWFSRRLGRFSSILKVNAWMHIFSPILIAGATVMGILRNITYLTESNLMLVLSSVEFYCIVSWLLARTNRSIFGFKTVGTVLCGLENLFVAIVYAGMGKSLHMWDQHQEIRKLISDDD